GLLLVVELDAGGVVGALADGDERSHHEREHRGGGDEAGAPRGRARGETGDQVVVGQLGGHVAGEALGGGREAGVEAREVVAGSGGVGHRSASSEASRVASVWRALCRWALAVPSAQPSASAMSAML